MVEDPAQIKPAIQRAFAARTVAVINVMSDPMGTTGKNRRQEF